MVNAGRILIIPKGDYDANASYTMLDLVSHNGTSWLARKDATGIEPSEANSEYWHEMVEVNLANNLTTVAEGYALDARQAKVLDGKIAQLSTSLTALSASLGNFKLHDKQLLAGVTGGLLEVTMTKTLATGVYLMIIQDATGTNSDHLIPIYVLNQQGTNSRADAIVTSARIQSVTFNAGIPVVKFNNISYPNVFVYRIA